MPAPNRPVAPCAPAVRRTLGAAVFCLALAACGRPVELLRLDLSSAELKVPARSGRYLLEAGGVYSDGSHELVVAEWVSSVPSVATIERCDPAVRSFCVTALGVGESVLTATFEDQRASARVIVQ